MNNKFIAYPVGHTLGESLKVEFTTEKEAQAFCNRENDYIVANDYDGDEDAWLDDAYAVSWVVFDTDYNSL